MNDNNEGEWGDNNTYSDVN